MKGWLLDTNVISELRKTRPEGKVERFIRLQPASELFLSEVTTAEILHGIERVSDPIRRSELLNWLETVVRPVFDGRILPVTEAVIVRWKHLVFAGQQRRYTFAQPDLFIAAQAAIHGLIVVSRDTVPYLEAAVPVLDPWTETFHPPGRASLSTHPALTLADALRILSAGRGSGRAKP